MLFNILLLTIFVTLDVGDFLKAKMRQLDVTKVSRNKPVQTSTGHPKRVPYHTTNNQSALGKIDFILTSVLRRSKPRVPNLALYGSKPANGHKNQVINKE